MPYTLQHKETGQIFACPQRNNYKLVYYGVKYWEFEDEAEEQAAAFLAEQGVPNPESWVVTETEEHRVKIYNVKLKNNPDLSLYVTSEGLIQVRAAE